MLGNLNEWPEWGSEITKMPREIATAYKQWSSPNGNVQTSFQTWQRVRDWIKQNPVTSRPLPYYLYDVKVTKEAIPAIGNGNPFPTPGVASVTNSHLASYLAGSLGARDRQREFNNAYRSFVNQVERYQAGLGETIAEWRQSATSIRQTAQRFAGLVRSIRRKDPAGFYSWFQTASRTKGGVVKNNRFGSADWLQLQLGFRPLVNSIETCIDITTKPILATHRNVKGKSKHPFRERYSGGNGPDQWLVLISGTALVKISGKASIRNDNLLLAQQLGILNPPLLLWQLTMLSFVFDWFLDVSLYLGALTDMAGVELTDTSTTYFSVGESTETRNYSTLHATGKLDGAYMQRVVGIPAPLPVWTNPFAELERDWGKAITAIALVLQLLSG